MRPIGAGASLRLGVLTDVHLAEPGTADSKWIGRQPLGKSALLLSQAIDRLSGADLDGLVLLGDLTQDGRAEQFIMLADALSGWGTPVWAVHGNHDLGHGPDPLNSQAASRLSTAPDPAGIDVRGLRLAAGRLARAGDEGTAYRETAPPQPRLWRQGQLTVWLSHFPVADVRPVLRQAGLPHPGDLVNRAAVMAMLASCSGPVLVLAGHTHIRATVTADRVLQLSFPALIEEPHELSILELGTGPGPQRIRRTAHALAAAHPMGRGDLSPVTETWAYRSGRWHPA